MVCLDVQGTAALWFDWQKREMYWMCNETADKFYYYTGRDYSLMRDIYDQVIINAIHMLYDYRVMFALEIFF